MGKMKDHSFHDGFAAVLLEFRRSCRISSSFGMINGVAAQQFALPGGRSGA